MFCQAFVVAVLAALAYGKPLARSMQVHEARTAVPSGFSLKGPTSPETMLELRIALVRGDMAGLEKVLYDVSTPSSAHYGQHLSKEEVESFVAPTSETVFAVMAWLNENNITATTTSPAGDWLKVSVPVSKANELLDADFSEFTHIDSGRTYIRTLSYSIPTDLQGHLDFVHPTTVFTKPFKSPQLVTPPKLNLNLTSNDVPDESCGSRVTPDCVLAQYQIPPTQATRRNNVLGVGGFVDEWAQEDDLRSFLASLRPESPPVEFSVLTVDGGSDPQGTNESGAAADRDTQYTAGIASGVPVVFISVGENNPDNVAGFLDMINLLLNEDDPPQVLTTSYGFDEADLSSSVANNLCDAYMQLGVRGTTILFASGDGGVSGSMSQTCDDGMFIPTFPSVCPYVTSVGATSDIKETAATFSSGGFSAFFERPSYQNPAVTEYLDTLGTTYSGKFVSTGRAYPDVAAWGRDLEIIVGGEEMCVSGTGGSTAIFASIIALLNDELIAANASPLGFLNPRLYESTAVALALNDITTGNNPGCNTEGFPAGEGWDPVTGLGTPSFAALRAAIGLSDCPCEQPMLEDMVSMNATDAE